MKAFDVSRAEAKLLYRVIRSKQDIQIYVQSEAVPQWERIEHNGFRCMRSKNINGLIDLFCMDQILRFSLLGCPSKKVAGNGKNSQRVILRSENEQLDWLKRQGEKNGFKTLEAYVAGNAELLSGKKTSGEFHLAGIPFEGVLQIADPDAFRKGFENGIGAEKAYGFGMLMVMKKA